MNSLRTKKSKIWNNCSVLSKQRLNSIISSIDTLVLVRTSDSDYFRSKQKFIFSSVSIPDHCSAGRRWARRPRPLRLFYLRNFWANEIFLKKILTEVLQEVERTFEVSLSASFSPWLIKSSPFKCQHPGSSDPLIIIFIV